MVEKRGSKYSSLEKVVNKLFQYAIESWRKDVFLVLRPVNQNRNLTKHLFLCH